MNLFLNLCSPSPSNFYGTQSPEPRYIDPVSSENCPQYESHWMSAELLTLSVDYIDTLLEDWYPGLGSREGGKTMDSIPYVNRVIPCPYCVNSAIPLEEEMAADVGGVHYTTCLIFNLIFFYAQLPLVTGSSPDSQRGSSCSPSTTKKGLKMSRSSKKPRNSQLSSSPSNSSSISSSSSKAKRSLFPGSMKKQAMSSLSSQESVGEERPTRRQGSLLELQGKLGVL